MVQSKIYFICGDPGETMFIPYGWWRIANSLMPTVSVDLDCLNDSNWKNFMGEVDIMMSRNSKTKAILASLLLSVITAGLSNTRKTMPKNLVLLLYRFGSENLRCIAAFSRFVLFVFRVFVNS